MSIDPVDRFVFRVADRFLKDHPIDERQALTYAYLHACRVMTRYAAILKAQRDKAQATAHNLSDVLADAYGDYCEDNPDPDHCPTSPWVEWAQDLLGSERCNAIFEKRAMGGGGLRVITGVHGPRGERP